MENSILEEKVIIGAYKNIVDSINELDVNDKTEEIQRKTAELEQKEKENAESVEKSDVVYGKAAESATVFFVDEYKNRQDEIDELKNKQAKVSENQEKAKILEERRKTVRENLKNKKDTEIKNREDEIKSIESKISNIKKAKEKIEEEKVGNFRKELAEIEENEKNNPNKARDEKYKDYLRNKIEQGISEIDFSGMDSQIKEYEQEINKNEHEIKNINVEYREILKNLGRIDRGENVMLEKPEEKKTEMSNEKIEKEEAKIDNEKEELDNEKEEIDEIECIEELDDKKQEQSDYYELEQEENNNLKNVPEIKIGRNTVMINGEKITKIDKTSKLFKNDAIKGFSEILDTEIDEQYASLIEEKLDPVIMNSMISLCKNNVISKKDLQFMVEDFINGDIDKIKEKVKISYDLEDLSKGAFLPWKIKERTIIARNATKGYELGTVALIGEYEPNPFKRAINKIKRKAMPEAGKYYDDDYETIDETKTINKREKFVKSLDEKENINIEEVVKKANERIKELNEKDSEQIIQESGERND